VHRLYIKANWRPDGVWPQWFGSARSLSNPDASGLLH
jgi:hypothetical protein